MYEQGHVFDAETSNALTDMLFGGNITQKNLGYVLGDIGATKTLEKLLGMNIDEKTRVDTVKRKVRDMINSYRAGQGKLFDTVAVRKISMLRLYEDSLKRIGANDIVIAGFKNALLNGELTESQAIEIASDVDAFDLYVKATAGRLGTNPTIDDMIKAAGYVGGFDLAGDISPYYDKGYSETIESDTLVPDSETGVYDAGNGTVVLNKKAEPIKKLSYKLAQELLSDVANEHKTSENVHYSFGVTQTDINNYVDASYKKENTEDYKKYAEASTKLISDVTDEIDINGYVHAFRDNDIRHIRNSHGESTNEKYPVISDDIKQIPWIVENYDKVFVKTNSRGKPGIVYVKVTSDNAIYYVEAVTEEYHNEKLLVNKQMIKTGFNEIPNLYGLIEAINKKEGSSQYLADLEQIRKAYVQDVKGNYLDNMISNPNENVNDILKNNHNLLGEKTVQTNDNTLVNSVIDYMSANGYDLDSEVNRVIKKFNPYILEHRARLNSSLLSEQSLQREIAADFLTSVFSDEAAMQKLADTDLSLAVELAERVKAFANSTSDGMMKDFANDVFAKIHQYCRTKINPMKFNSVLKERKKQGLSNDAIIEADNEFFKTIELDNFNFDDMKKEALDTGNAAYRKWVDSGEAFARLGKELGVNDLYAAFNSIRQAN